MALQTSKTFEWEHEALDLVLHLPEFSRSRVGQKELETRYPTLGRLHPIVVSSLVRATLFPIPKKPGQLPRFMPMRLNLPQRSFSQGEEARPMDPEALQHARIWGLLGFLAGAWETCEDSWRVLDPQGWELPFLDVALAQIYQRDGRLALALQRLQRAISLFPGLEDLRLDLAEIAIELSDDQKAMQVLDEVRKKTRGTGRWKVLRARALAIGSPRKARVLLEKLREEAPKDPSIRFALARIQYRLGEYGLALAQLRPLVQRFPHNTAYRLSLARAALRLGDARLYLEQVAYVVQVRFGLFRSTGEKRDLLDILQLGGLRRLYERGVQLRSQFGSRDITGVSDAFWRGLVGWKSREEVEEHYLGKARSTAKKKK
jgi:tetratricopeptide (TPR) repeat protein